MKPEQVQALEDAANDKIRQHVPVSVKLLSIDDPEVEKVPTVSIISMYDWNILQYFKHFFWVFELLH